MEYLKAKSIFNLTKNIETINYNFESIGITVVYFGLLSIVFEFICILVVFKAKNNLIKLEFYLINSICLSTIIVKIYTLFLIIILSNQNRLLIPKFLCIFLYSIGSFLSFSFFVLFYYSLFHITILNRNKHFVKLNDILKNPKVFLVFLFITLVTTYTFSLTFFTLSKDNIYSKLSQNYYCLGLFFDKSFGKLAILINLYNILPAVLTNIIYIVSQFLILSSYFKKGKNDIRKKKLHRITLKFFSYSIFSDITIILFLLSLLDYFESLFFILTAITFLIFLIVESFFLILIHNILRKEFFKLLKSLINSLLKIF